MLRLQCDELLQTEKGVKMRGLFMVLQHSVVKENAICLFILLRNKNGFINNET